MSFIGFSVLHVTDSILFGEFFLPVGQQTVVQPTPTTAKGSLSVTLVIELIQTCSGTGQFTVHLSKLFGL